MTDFMQSSCANGSVVVSWPREISIEDLDDAEQIVLLQFSSIRRHRARLKAGDVEYESWIAALATQKD